MSIPNRPQNTLTVATLGVLLGTSGGAMAQGVGYDDGPLIPGQRWRVHDKARPNPRVVDPGPAPTVQVPAPADATVLMDGSGLDAWVGRGGEDAKWTLIEGGATEVKAGTGDIQTRESFGDCQLHMEWATPPPKGDSQGRGNSGVFLLGIYEVQILDSYDNKSYADGQAAALYGQQPPEVNACRAPGEWQTFDIVFEAPRFDDGGELTTPGYITVIHNGIMVHHRREILGTTFHRRAPAYSAHASTGPIKLQDHGNPMRFRNMWVRPITTGNAESAPEGEDAALEVGGL